MNEDGVIRKLQSVGKAVFVEYFCAFEDYAAGKMTRQACIDLLVRAAVSNDAGAAIRCGNAKALFDANRAIDALTIVAESERVPLPLVQSARKLIELRTMGRAS